MSARDPLCRALEDPTATCVSLPRGWGYPVHGSRKQLPHSSRWYSVQCNLPARVSRPAGRSGGHLGGPVVHILSFFSFFSRKKFLLFFFLVFLSDMFYCWHYYQSLTVSFVVGAPWRCGVLTTEGGIAGIGLGRLLGGEHDSTLQSGVEAPRLLKRSLSRLYCCCCCF